jgi:hypothetical protein
MAACMEGGREGAKMGGIIKEYSRKSSNSFPYLINFVPCHPILE